MIKVGIVGYGNLGKACEGIAHVDDRFELVGIFTRRDPSGMSSGLGSKFYAQSDIKKFKDKNVTLAECELFTGRTHQIRVHLKSIGHTIVGDELYGKGIDIEKGVKRQFLHAYRIKFTHPVTKKEMEIEIPLAEDMKEFLEK